MVIVWLIDCVVKFCLGNFLKTSVLHFHFPRLSLCQNSLAGHPKNLLSILKKDSMFGSLSVCPLWCIGLRNALYISYVYKFNFGEERSVISHKVLNPPSFFEKWGWGVVFFFLCPTLQGLYLYLQYQNPAVLPEPKIVWPSLNYGNKQINN